MPSFTVAMAAAATLAAAYFFAGCEASSSSSFLAQQALTKVLRDGSQVFGAAGTSNASTAQWMRAVDDATLLVHMNIPGTHESATWNFTQATKDALAPDGGGRVREPAVYRCQRQSLADALQAGVRAFDLRYALDPTGTQLVFWHNEALLSELATVEDVLLFGFPRWLDRHPSETVIVSM